MSSPMHTLHRGSRLKLYYANRRWFTHPGVYVWAFGNNRRLIPLPRRRRR